MSDTSHAKLDTAAGVLIARVLCEKMSEYEAGVLEKDLGEAARNHQWKLGLDMTNVQLVASVGLGTLVSLNRSAKSNKGKLVLFNLHPNIRQVLRITRLDTGLSIAENEEAAVKSLR